jgi:light-regulated signal transduction histidine kinase (bacteriophytochrome)
MVDDRTKELDDKIKELEMQRAATLNMLEDVNETKKELERANRDLEDFTSTVSHDLKVPLRAIQAFNTLPRDYYADTLDETGREYLDKSDKPKVEVSCEETGKSYLFKVKDNGIGVEENYLSSIFDIAERLNPQEYEGTGFGLNIPHDLFSEPQDYTDFHENLVKSRGFLY